MLGRVGFLFIPLVSGLAYAAEPPSRDQAALNSILWAGTAVEHDASILQTYHQARLMLDRALRDRNWTAAVEQRNGLRSLPPAIIMDIDETILDNSPVEALMIAHGGGYDDRSWQEWVAGETAKPLPGSVEFAMYARTRGVTVFYVTNREATQKDATRSNLAKAGFPLQERIDTLYCRGERPEWGSDKATRRAEIAAHYRVLLLFGDDLNDFISGADTTVANRRTLVEHYRDNWGVKWFVLPNSMYGSWETTLYRSAVNPDEQEKQRLKDEALRRMFASTASQ